eukprot:760036-Hanusia_phi.AAC.3
MHVNFTYHTCLALSIGDGSQHRASSYHLDSHAAGTITAQRDWSPMISSSPHGATARRPGPVSPIRTVTVITEVAGRAGCALRFTNEAADVPRPGPESEMFFCRC